ncbi:hypothetical protein [Brevundimonas sp. NPDC046655]|uniref:DUF7662 domain-containing protein n=1 Tax=unclassified Brevundimonas TaxID=2622653 RepID=UPI00384B06EF
MGKYDPLRDYLKRQKVDALELSFAEIELRLRAMLPKGASLPQWWADEAEPTPRDIQKDAWRAAGFDACLIPGKERVRFVRRR